MIKTPKLLVTLEKNLKDSTSWDYKVALSVVLLTASVSALRVAFNIGYSIAKNEPEYLKCIDLSGNEWSIGFLESYLMPIVVGLLLSFIGLWLRRATGFFLSLLALLWVVQVYIAWYLATLSIMRDVEITDFSRMPFQQQQILTLNNAVWWDIAVLSVTVILCVWHIKALIKFWLSKEGQ